MKTIAIILFTIIFGFLLHSQLAQAQPIIYKWIDEKGTTHYSEDPNAVPEKYKNKTEKKDIDEFPPLLPDKLKRPQSYSSEPSSKPTQRSRPVRRVESESVGSGRPSPGYVPFEKFVHIRNGMSEAEVLSRLGSPTKEEITGQTSSDQTITGNVDRGGYLRGRISEGTSDVTKKYYYLGDFDRSEKTTVITFSGGTVIGIQRISSPHW